MSRQNKIYRWWNALPLFWKTSALSAALAISVVMIGEGAEGLAQKLLYLADLNVKSNVREALLWLIAIIASSLAGSFFISRVITNGLVRIQPVVEALSGGDLTSRAGAAETERGDEIGSLGRSFNQMADNVARLLENERALIRDISHEMRSPLTRMKMAASLLQEEAGPLDAAQGHIRQLEKDIDRMEAMVGQMLDRARLETMAQAGLEKTEFDLAGLVRESVEELEVGAPGKSIQWEGLRSAPCFGNAVLMRRAVDNLIKNALHYTAPGSAVTVRLRSAPGAVFLDVIDQGPGVPEEKLDDIFRPFFRADEARARNSGGFGLGLAIARQAAQAHGGQVMAMNVSGASKTGLKVTLALPVCQN